MSAHSASSITDPADPDQPSTSHLTPVGHLRDIGARIRAIRKAQGLRIDDAASLCGVSVDLFSRLENGKGGVGTDKVLLILHNLGLELVLADKGHPGLRQLMREEPGHG